MDLVSPRRPLSIVVLLSVLCTGTGAAQARRAPAKPSGHPPAGTYRLNYETRDQRWDGHTQASSGHRGGLTLTLRRAAATLKLKDRWSYSSSSDHGVSGGPVRMLYRNIRYHYTWRGRLRRAGGKIDLSLAVTAATCTALPRRGRGAGSKMPCEERPALRLTCALGSERVHNASRADAAEPVVVKPGEAARPVQTLRCASPAPLTRLLDFLPHGASIPLTRGAPLQLYREKNSDGKTKAALRRR